MKNIRAWFEYAMYRYGQFLPEKISEKYDFPSKFLVKHFFEKDPVSIIKYRYQKIAHMYCYDSTVSVDDLSLIHSCYGTATRERVRQCLWKYIRVAKSRILKK